MIKQLSLYKKRNYYSSVDCVFLLKYKYRSLLQLIVNRIDIGTFLTAVEVSTTTTTATGATTTTGK